MCTPKLPDGWSQTPSLKVLPVHGSVVNPLTDKPPPPPPPHISIDFMV